jgi:hypothetical protein
MPPAQYGTYMESEQDRLARFFYTVEEIRRSNFAKAAFEGEINFTITASEDAPLTTLLKVPSREATNAMLLTLRLVTRNQDHISAGQISEEIMTPLVAEFPAAARFADARTKMNNWLDCSPELQMVVNDFKIPTNRWIMDTIMYGELVHHNPTKRAQIEPFRRNDTTSKMLDFLFHGTVKQVLNFLFYMQGQARQIARDKHGIGLATKRENDQ